MANPKTKSEKSPGIISVLNFLALISVVSGIFCAFYFWPDYGNRLIRETLIMYSMALFVSGIIGAVIFVAMSSAIKLLYQIDQRLARGLGRPTRNEETPFGESKEEEEEAEAEGKGEVVEFYRGSKIRSQEGKFLVGESTFDDLQAAHSYLDKKFLAAIENYKLMGQN